MAEAGAVAVPGIEDRRIEDLAKRLKDWREGAPSYDRCMDARGQEAMQEAQA